MEPRVEYAKVAPEVVRVVRNLDARVERSDLEPGFSGQRMWVLP